MRRGHRVGGAGLLVMLLCAPTWAEGWPPPPDVTAWIGAASNEAVQAAETGDLSGRGTTDWAGVVRPASFDVQAHPLGGWQAVVFLQQPDGHYRLAAQSQPFSFDCGSSHCWLEGMRIARQSVFVEMKSIWHDQFSDDTYQFKAKAGGWPLIGIVQSIKGDPDDGPSWNQTIDQNRLTGQIVVTCQMGNKPGHVTRTRAPAPKVTLADFDMLFSDWAYDLPGRCKHG